MKERKISAAIRAHPIFKDLPSEPVQRVTEAAFDMHFSYGEYVFREGEAAERFYLIQHGIIAIENHADDIEPVTIESLGKGHMVGWSWMFPPYRWRFDARAIEHTNVIAFDAETVRGLMQEDKDFGFELAIRFSSLMTDRLYAAQRQLLGLFGAFQRAQSGQSG